MGWFFGCFKCKKRRKRGIPSAGGASHATNKKQGRSAAYAVLGRSTAASPLISGGEASNREDLFKVRQTPAGSSASSSYIPREPFELNSPSLRSLAQSNNAVKLEDERNLFTGSIPEKKDLSIGKPSSDPWSQVDELEEELEKLRWKLAHEAEEAKKLRDEVKHLRTCGALLKSPNEFKKALESLQKTSPGKVEGDWHSWLLPSISAIDEIQLEKDHGSLHDACSSQPTKQCHDLLQGCPSVCDGLQNRITNASQQVGSRPIAESDDGLSDIKIALSDTNVMQESSGTEQSTNGISGADEPTHSAEVGHTRVESKDHEFSLSECSLRDSAIKRIPGDQEYFEIFEISEDLLEQIDGSSLITDSELVANWERSQGKVDTRGHYLPEKSGQSSSLDTSQTREVSQSFKVDIAAKGEDRLRAESRSSIQKRQKILSARTIRAHSYSIKSGTSGRPDVTQQIHRSKGQALSTVPQEAKVLSCLNNRILPDEDEAKSKYNSQLEYKFIRHIFERTSSGESGGSKSSARDIQETDVSSGDLESASQSLFAFSPDSTSQSQSVSFASTGDGKAVTSEAFSEGSFSNSESEAESLSENASSHSGSYTSTEGSEIAPVCCLSPSFTSTRQRCDTSEGDNIFDVETSSSAHATWEQQPVDSGEDDYDLFSDAVSHVSTECTETGNDIHGCSDSVDSPCVAFDQTYHLSDASSFPKETAVQVGKSQSPGTADKTLARKNVMLRKKSTSSVLTPVENLAQWKQLKEECCSSTETSARKHEPSQQHGKFSVNTKVTPARKQKQVARALDLNSADQDENNEAVGLSDGSISNSAFEDNKILRTSDTQCVDTSLSDWLKPSPLQEQDQPDVPGKSDEGTSKQYQTPSVTNSATSSQVQTPPQSMHGQRSPAKLADDRPILGMVAAHWSHLSTRKWWDGKGIPNSTNKYKEDQKVNWHATPFEVRLERALAKQGLVFQKKLSGGAVAADMDLHSGGSNTGSPE